MKRDDIRLLVTRWHRSSTDARKTLLRSYEEEHGTEYTADKWLAFLEAAFRKEDRRIWSLCGHGGDITEAGSRGGSACF